MNNLVQFSFSMDRGYFTCIVAMALIAFTLIGVVFSVALSACVTEVCDCLELAIKKA